MAYYQSLREYLTELDRVGKLVTISNAINKDTELAPLVRLQFRGLPEGQRKGFLFTNVVDSKGKKYDMPVAMGAMAASTDVYALAMQCKPSEIQEKLAQAYMRPIAPELVNKGPVQDVVYMGDKLLEKGGNAEFPEPISTPGRDSGPIASASCWVTKDPDTGARNVGVYRSQVFAPDRRGIHVHSSGLTEAHAEQHLAIHWQKARARGKPLQAAIVFGGPPNLVLVGPMKLARDADEYGVAGAIAGAPVALVKCKTVDLEVPANAEVVLEGELTTEELEMEAPHGEGAGIVGMQEMMPYFTVKCITHRRNPIWLTLASQMGPSESQKQTQMQQNAMTYKRLKYDLGLSSVLKVGNPEFTMISRGVLTIIQMKMQSSQDEVWRALEAAGGGGGGRITIAVDEDIDPWHPDQFWWAIAARTLPLLDFKIAKRKTLTYRGDGHQDEEEVIRQLHQQFDPRVLKMQESGQLLINATLKRLSPPVALPTKEFMEGALRIWQKEGLPPLKQNQPWYSYELGHWPKQFAEEAARAVKGDYYKTSEERAKNRVKVNYPVISAKD